LGRIDNKRRSFADGISLAFEDCFAIGFSRANTVGFTTNIRFTGCIPYRDSVSDPVSNGVAETGRLAGSIPFAVRDLVKPGFSLDARCFANTRGAEPAKKTTATATA
jgi:hypothetical protein